MLYILERKKIINSLKTDASFFFFFLSRMMIFLAESHKNSFWNFVFRFLLWLDAELHPSPRQWKGSIASINPKTKKHIFIYLFQIQLQKYNQRCQALCFFFNSPLGAPPAGCWFWHFYSSLSVLSNRVVNSVEATTLDPFWTFLVVPKSSVKSEDKEAFTVEGRMDPQVISAQWIQNLLLNFNSTGYCKMSSFYDLSYLFLSLAAVWKFMMLMLKKGCLEKKVPKRLSSQKCRSILTYLEHIIFSNLQI